MQGNQMQIQQILELKAKNNRKKINSYSKANMQQLLGPKITIAEPRPSERNW